MYEYISGKAVELTPAYVVIDVQGVGYFLRISVYTFEKIEGRENVQLFTEFVVREDGHYLFGFFEKSERELFRQLVSVSGIGISSAMLILSALSPEQLREAIVREDVAILKSIKGIGPKTAKRLIVELKDKLMKSYQDTPVVSGVPTGNQFEEATLALEVLGYPRKLTHKIIREILKENPSISSEKIIKEALKRL